jgi:cold shock CspA family protein
LWCKSRFKEIPATATLIRGETRGAKLNGLLYLFGSPEKAHLIVDRLPDAEEVEMELRFDDDGNRFRWRKPKAPSAPPMPADPMVEALVEAATAPREPVQRPRFSEDVRTTWRNESEAIRSAPPKAEPVATARPAIQHRSGIISEVNTSRQYFFIEDEGGERYFAHQTQALKPKGHYYCIYKAGEAVLFDALPDDTRALNVRLEAEPALPSIETGKIVHWNSERLYGFAKRNCGCDVYISGDRVATFGIETLKPGSQIQFELASRGAKSMAVNIEIFQDEPTQSIFGQKLSEALQAVQ